MKVDIPVALAWRKTIEQIIWEGHAVSADRAEAHSLDELQLDEEDQSIGAIGAFRSILSGQERGGMFGRYLQAK